MTVIFAIPRTYYGSYADLYALIDLSGFEKLFIDEIDPQSSNTYIITVRNDEIGGGWAGAKARIILYDLEYRREPQAPIPGIPEVWHMDKSQAELIGAKYVPIGGHPGLAWLEPTEAFNQATMNTNGDDQYDVAFLAYMTHRRQRVYNDLQARGVRLTMTSAWGGERYHALTTSRVYLHVHQHDDIPAVPGLRLVVAAAYKLPVIMEACADYGVFEGYVYDSEFQHLVGLTHAFMQPERAVGLAEIGGALHQFLCVDYTFRRSVEAALS